MIGGGEGSQTTQLATTYVERSNLILWMRMLDAFSSELWPDSTGFCSIKRKKVGGELLCLVLDSSSV